MIELKYKIGAALLAILVCYVLYTSWRINTLNNDLEKAKIQYDISEQNNKAYQDQISMKDDSIKSFYVFVKELNKNNGEITKKYRELEKSYILVRSEYETVLKEYTDLGKAYGSIINDTVYVRFDSAHSGISYNGRTSYYLKNGASDYSLSLRIDPKKIESILFIDSTKKYIRNLVYFGGDLVHTGKTEIDPKLFIVVTKNPEIFTKDTSSILDKIYFASSIEFPIEKDMTNFNKNSLYLNVYLGYDFNSVNIYGMYTTKNSSFNAGVIWKSSISNILRVF